MVLIYHSDSFLSDLIYARWVTNEFIRGTRAKTTVFGEPGDDRPSIDFAGIGSEILTVDRVDALLSQGFVWIVRGVAGLTVLLLGWIGWVIFQKAQPAIQTFGLGFLTNQEWNINDLKFGALPTFTELWLAQRSRWCWPFRLELR